MKVKPINTRLKQMEEEMRILKDGKSEGNKGFKMPGKAERKRKASLKKNNYDKILFYYLKKNGIMEGPVLCKYDDDTIVYNNRAYEVDPRAIWKWGKYNTYLYKEVDRRPISNLNLREIKRRGDLTESDEILLKATMRAISGPLKKKMSRGALVGIGIAVIVIIVAFSMMGGGT